MMVIILVMMKGKMLVMNGRRTDNDAGDSEGRR